MKFRKSVNLIIKLVIPILSFCETVSAQNVPAETDKPPVAAPLSPAAGYDSVLRNYICTWEPSMPLTNPADVSNAGRPAAEVKLTTAYFDAIGRPLQTVSKQMSGTGKDLVSMFLYDNVGREKLKYLPYASQTGANDGKFKLNPFADQKDFYQSETLNPGSVNETVYYSEVEFEASPLNRILKTYSPGNSWAQTGGSHPVGQQYDANTTEDAVRIWKIADDQSIPVSPGTYATKQLYKVITSDEQGQTTIAFTDKDGRLILKKIQLNNDWLSTYYVYDDSGNLRFVIPPRAVQIINGNWNLAPVAAELCFQYQYDERNRMIVKKVPGAAPVEMVYDIRDRLVLTRDGNLKSKRQWLMSFYDGLNRVVETALYTADTNTYTRAVLQQQLNTSTGTGSIQYDFPGVTHLVVKTNDRQLYEARESITIEPDFESASGDNLDFRVDPALSNGSIYLPVTNPLPNIPAAALTPLTFTYYDHYAYDGLKTAVAADFTKPQAGSNLYAQPVQTNTAPEGMATGTRIRVLGTDTWLTTTNYYDDDNRLVQTISDNLGGGQDVATTLYDFSGKVLSTYVHHRTKQSSATPETKVLTMMHYDHAGRVDEITKRINDNPALQRTIVTNSYNELGQIKTKRLGITGTGQLETLDYEYNIRGWLKGINRKFATGKASSNWFGQELSYDYGFSGKQFNGNIAGAKWKSRSDGVARAFGYRYDPVNRLTAADFSQLEGSASWTKSKMDFSVSNLTYDANGNILSMSQKGMEGSVIKQIDSLKYGYLSNSNKLSFVTDKQNNPNTLLGDFREKQNDESPDYQYDLNGNLVLDQNKQLTIRYNHLNLPENIVVTGKGSITYTYDAGGNKLRKTVVDQTGTGKTTVTDYTGMFQYTNDTLRIISHEEGRIRTIVKAGTPLDYKYDYFIKDHLGNIRMVLTEQTDFTMYAATMENTRAGVETALFSNVNETRVPKPAGYPNDDMDSKNAAVAKLNANPGGNKIGPSLVLRVMAGDTIQVNARAFYKSQGPVTQNAPPPPEDMVAGLVQAFGGQAEGGSQHGFAAGNNSTPFNTNFYNNQYQRLKEKSPDQPDSKPKAYLNFVLFDDQFKLVDQNSGVKQVSGEADQLQTLGTDRMPITKNGFLYVYTSNESQQDVFFDNLVVTQASGPVLEETHYYPFGLTMAGISSNALKGSSYAENKYKFTGQLLDEDLGWNTYQMKWRTMDPQIGRFLQVDPLATKYVHNSPYAYAENKVTTGIDLEGLEWVSRIDGNGATSVNANVKFSVNEMLKLTPEQITAYQTAISNQLNKTLQISSDGSISGNVTYNGGNASKLRVVVPSLELYGKASIVGGQTTFSASSINVFDKEGNLRSPESVGIDGAHELLHTLRLEHPFEKTQGVDTKLISEGGNNYSTTPGTDSKIPFNIMNYPMINIDGKKSGDLWKSTGQSPSYLTKDQVKILLNEIKLQNTGAGAPGSSGFQNYWINTPGEEVKRKIK
ncbi:RHS repeat-associated core domain-containing protein [Chitinophaga eiseniae]|uniref:RHS repeat-associated core domain-containing protein n=1 Tax=Chitinophaga eiseniae TaxID=634771 RepID=A0A1T4TLR6_9BACT|nr:DUF6443 domain-containing protein [Chitinophaga eiseniae]SKA41221.1 RHS repeat-associated core domain-containing protein [Chitinophaga eiseniae]